MAHSSDPSRPNQRTGRPVRSGLSRYLDRRALVVAGVVVLLPALVLLPGRMRLGAEAASCDGPSTILNVLASPGEFSEHLQARAKAFMASGPQVDGRCVRVQVMPKSPGGALESFHHGWDPRADGPAPDVWSPSSSAWVWLLNDQLDENGEHGPITGRPATVAMSPMVIAMPRPMAVALGWPKAQIGWSELLDLARSRKSWTQFGHPEWGEFKLGKTNPNLSDSGLAATLTAYYTATGRTASLSARDLQSLTVRRLVAGVEQSVMHYGDSDTAFLSDLRRADDAGQALSYVSAVVTEERMVWQYNQGNPGGDPATLGRRAKPKVPLAAIYPKEGTLLADHPYAIVTADPAKRAAAGDFLAYLHSDEVQQALQRDGFRDRQVTAGGLVLEDSGILPDQPKVVMPLPDPEVIGLVLKGWPALRKRSNVLTLIDTSGSMSEPAAGSGVRRDVVPRVVDDLEASGGTALFNSTLAAWRALRERYQPSAVNVLLLISDGVDSDTETISLPALLRTLESEQDGRAVRIITIAYGQGADRPALRKIADASGGTAYEAIDPTDIEDVFAEAIAGT